VWLGLAVGGISLLITFLFGLHAYITATATPIHPAVQDVPSVTGLAPAPRWRVAVERGRAIMRTVVAERNLPGVSVAVGSGGEIVWAEGFGWADLEARVPVSPDTRFRIGTASTVLTSAAVGLLLEKQRLTLDDPIQTYVPAYPKKPWPVTLRQLMGHTAGLTSDGGDEGPLYGSACEHPAEAFEAFADDDLRFQPGTDFRFSAFGWIVVSAAVEAVADEPFLTVMQKQVFEPLGMHATGADTERMPDRATSYFPRYSADPRYGPDPMREVDYSCYAGSSVFVSTPSDLVRFALAVNGGTLLQPRTVQLLQTAQRLPSGKDTGYGLGWDRETVDIAGTPTTAVGHDGQLLGGPAASLLTFRDRGLVVAVLSNTSYADPEAIAAQVARAFAEAATLDGPR
jgi:CubicO group peptidase (beta-lactamase class C family)